MGIASTVNNQFEEALIYPKGNQQIEVVVSHEPGKPITLTLARWPIIDPTTVDFDPEPLAWQEFTGVELRERLAFFQALRDNGILGQDGLLAIA